MTASSSSSDAKSPPESNGSSAPSSGSSALPTKTIESELAKALQDLDRGEKAASSLENDLSRLEARLDEILAGLDPGVLEAPDAADAQKHEPTAKDDGSKK